MKIISWNVAGLRACYKKGLEEFFLSELPDMFCMQETKVLEKENPLHIEGYKEYLYPAEKKGYSGTMIYSKIEPLSIKYGIGIEEFDSEGRVITLEYDNFYLVNAYVPNSKRELERLNERMYFEDEMRKYLKNLNKNVIYCGDLNVAHEEIDIKNAKTNTRSAGFTIEERNKMTELLESGFTDTFRYLYPDTIKYSWWSYKFKAREKNTGWRIDYFVVSNRFVDKIKDALILNDVMGSDHCPVGVIL